MRLLLFFLIFIYSLFAQARDVHDVYDAGVSSYVYAFPAVLIERSKQVMTNVSAAQTDGRAPINQFSHAQVLATPRSTDIVRPNCDTLYSNAWLDLSEEPIVLSVPDTQDRYYVMPLLDAWSDVFDSIGKRTTGVKPGHFIIIGPDWRGLIPPDLTVIHSLTNTVWITGRTLTTGAGDYHTVHDIQQGYKLTPLSQWGTNYTPPINLPVDPDIDMSSTPLTQVTQMDATTFFTLFSKILKKNPPHPEDVAILGQLKIIGIIPGEDFNPSSLSKYELKELDRAVHDALIEIEKYVYRMSYDDNGWDLPRIIGTYGVSYLSRASMGYIGLGANITADSIYPTAYQDIKHHLFNGSNQYVLHFDAKDMPPANGFWSVTLYGLDNYLVPNKLNRYTLGDRSNMFFNADGSLDIYIQKEDPGENKMSNWLPAPQGGFSLTLRLYWPQEKALNGDWQPSRITETVSKKV